MERTFVRLAGFLVASVVAGGYTVPGGVATGGGVPGCPGVVVPVPTAGSVVLLGLMGVPGVTVVVLGLVWARAGRLSAAPRSARPNR
jgi:hypothetical protein